MVLSLVITTEELLLCRCSDTIIYEGFQISHDMSPVSEGVCCNSSCTVLNTEHKDNETVVKLSLDV